MALRAGSNNWQPSAAAVRGADASTAGYNNPPLRSEVPSQHKSATRTQVPIAPGTQVLSDYVRANFRGIRTVYLPGRSRPMVDSQRLDTHQAGVAIDFMVSNPADGDAIANWLVENSGALGVQFVAWNGNKFNASQPRGRRLDAYNGASMHRDHPHVELNRAGAAMQTPWFGNRARPTAQESTAASSGPPAPLLDEGGTSAVATWVAIGVTAALCVAGVVWYARSRA